MWACAVGVMASDIFGGTGIMWKNGLRNELFGFRPLV
jgi:hypothetical protein